MAVRRRMITDEILCSTKFLNLHRETQMLYVFLLLFCDDDGIVEPFPVMRIAGFYNTTPLEELIEKEFVYLLDDDMLSFVVHFHNQNRISPSKKVDSRHLPKLIEKYPELQFKIVVSKNRNCPNSYSQILEKSKEIEINSNKSGIVYQKKQGEQQFGIELYQKQMEEKVKILPKERNKEINKEIKANPKYIPLPDDVRANIERLRKGDKD